MYYEDRAYLVLTAFALDAKLERSLPLPKVLGPLYYVDVPGDWEPSYESKCLCASLFRSSQIKPN